MPATLLSLMQSMQCRPLWPRSAFQLLFEAYIHSRNGFLVVERFTNCAGFAGEMRRQEALKRAEEYKAMETSGADQLLTDVKGMLGQQ